MSDVRPLHTRPRNHNKRWTATEDDYLRRHLRYGEREEVARALGRTVAAVEQRAMRIQVDVAREWTDADDQHLREHYGQTPTRDLANHLGRSVSAIYQRASALGIKHPGRRTWTEEEDAFLEAEYEHRTAAEIGERIGRTKTQVYARAATLGLQQRLSPEAEELLWKMRSHARVVTFFAEHFGIRERAVIRSLRKLEEAGGPARSVEPEISIEG